jgi:diketogulonate reductase-like aldo/keto reductase
MLATQPTLTLNNGVDLPALGFGVFQTPGDVTQGAVGLRNRRPPAVQVPAQDDLRGALVVLRGDARVRPERIAENLAIFDFSLTADDLAAINALDTGVRGGPNQDEVDFLTFNRPIPE